MHRAGHFGLALLAVAPLQAALHAAGRPAAAGTVAAGAVALSRLPDVDRSVPGLGHRGPTHSPPAVGLAGWLLWLAARSVPAAPWLPGPETWLAVGVLVTLSHVAGDALTPAGVAALWPASGRRLSLGLTTADDPVANHVLLVLGLAATAAALGLPAPWLLRLLDSALP